MVKAIQFVIDKGPAYGYRLNMRKCTYLIAPTESKLTGDELNKKLEALTALGIPLENIKIHPDCQSGLSSDVVARRQLERGFKTLGAFIGTDEYVLSALRRKTHDFQKFTQTLLLYPNIQARCRLHRFCFNAKVNYSMRAQYPAHISSRRSK